MRVLFYQPNHQGHHFAYLGRMLPGFVDLPIEIVIATTPEARRSPEFASSLGPFSDRIEVVECCTPAPRPPLANSRHRLNELKGAIAIIEPDHLAVNYADGLWDVAILETMMGRRPWPRSLTVEGWIYRGRFADPANRDWKSWLRQQMFVRLLRSGLFRAIHLHHELLFEFAASKSIGTSTSVVLAPDPIVIHELMDGAEARNRLGISIQGPRDEKWIGVAGVIARFKGAPQLLEAYRVRCELGDLPATRLLLAGPHDDDAQNKLQEPFFREAVEQGRICSIDRFLTEDEMYLAAAACDVVVAPYPRHQNRSSIILWAAAAGRPCLATEESCVGYVINKERLGETCNVLDTSGMANAITRVLTAPWTPEDVRRVREYASFHRMENYQAISSKVTRDRLAATGEFQAAVSNATGV